MLAIYVVVYLQLLEACSASNTTVPCPSKCGNSCKYNSEGEIISAKCKDVVVQHLPNSLQVLHIFDVADPYAMPLGRFTDFILDSKENLTSLKIENYRLRILESNCFLNSPNLESLDLTRNVIETISEDSFTGLTNLTYLNLNQNSLAKLGDYLFRQLPSLTELYISVNKLTSLGEDDFSGLTNIAKIVLQSNQITSIEEGTFSKLSTIEDINLQENKLTLIDRGLFANLPNLKYLNLQMNDIKTMDPLSMVGTKLLMLKVAENELTVIPTVLLQNIGNADLIVNFARNNITTISDGDFSGVTLKGLSLTTNRISQIGSEALQNSFIQMLDLKDNLLQHLPAAILEDVNPVMNLMLKNNPWSCDCDIQSVVSLIQITKEELTCATPKNYSGRALSNVTEELKVTCSWRVNDSSGKKGDNSGQTGIIVGSVIGSTALMGAIAATVIKCCVLSRKVAPKEEESHDEEEETE